MTSRTFGNRVALGYRELDDALYGGLPKGYAVLFTSPSCDERELLLRRFLERSVYEGEASVLVCRDLDRAKDLVEKYASVVNVLVCNPQAQLMTAERRNVLIVRRMENLSDLNISLSSMISNIEGLEGRPRFFVDVLSDVLLYHGAPTTRKWLSDIIPKLKAKGITMLATLNPNMHSPSDVEAVVDLFDGQISLYESKLHGKVRKFLRIKKMYREKYLDDELPLHEERLRMFYFTGSPPEECDMFLFMANRVGITVLHPGGLDVTRQLAGLCDLHHGKKVLDIGCGRGTSAIFLARNFGCSVTGIDIMEDSIGKARDLARRRKLQDRIEFRAADVNKLPFDDETFDAAIFQAVLMFTDKERALTEAKRVVKKGGYVGAVEFSWKKNPSMKSLEWACSKVCSVMANVLTYAGWEDLLKSVGLEDVRTTTLNGRRGFFQALGNEGRVNALRILFKYVSDSEVRRRMRSMTKFFDSHSDHLGVGIYVGRK